jgi:site-specific DNA-methyltransferase (adenine-specific)
MITYTNEDCMELMKRYPDKHFDLAIVDPPYGIGENGSKNDTRGKLAHAKTYKPFAGEDSQPPDESYFNELQRVSKNQIIWGANHFISKIPFDSSCWIVWDKVNSGDFADCELAWTSFKTAVRIFRFMWNGMLQGDMKNKEQRLHPTQKPVALYKWLLKNYAKQGDLILDTHVGSASSLIACHDMGFDVVGCELDLDYYTESKKRLEYFMKQPKLEDVEIRVIEQIELNDRPNYTKV